MKPVLQLIIFFILLPPHNIYAQDFSKVNPDRFGVYFWQGANYQTVIGNAFLRTGVDSADNMGVRAVRVVMNVASNFSYPYFQIRNCLGTPPATSGPWNLTGLAKRPDYKWLFDNPQLKTYMFTLRDFHSYTNDQCGSDFRNPHFLDPAWFTPANKDSVLKELRDLATYLWQTYPNKNFYWANWEGDHLVYGPCNESNPDPACVNPRIEAYKIYLALRTQAIRESGAKNVFSGVEINRPGRLLVDVVPHVNLDFVSYSSWGATSKLRPGDDSGFREVIHTVRREMQKAGVDSMSLILGEYGRSRNNKDGSYNPLELEIHKTGALAVEDLNIKHAFIWNLYDADPTSGCKACDDGLFSMMDSAYNLTPAGEFYCENIWHGKKCGQGYDVGISKITSPTGILDTVNFRPEVTLHNYGPSVLNEVTIFYRIDNKPLSKFLWKGKLNPWQEKIITLPVMTSDTGTHQFQAFTRNPNTIQDYKPANDSRKSVFTVIKKTFVPVVDTRLLKVSYPSKDICELNITPKVVLRNKGNVEVQSIVFNYNLNGGTIVSKSFYVPAGSGLKPGNDIELSLDQIFVPYGKNTLKIYSETPNGLKDADPVNDTITITFTVSCQINDARLEAIIIPDKYEPICADTALPRIKITNMGNTDIESIDVIYHVDGKNPLSRSLSVPPGNGLKPGASIIVNLNNVSNVGDGKRKFFATLEDPNGTADANPDDDTLSVEFQNTCITTGIIENSSFHSVRANPNPGTGVYELELAGFQNPAIRVFSPVGNLIEVITANKRQVDISDYAKGIYLLQVSEGLNSAMIKLVKW